MLAVLHHALHAVSPHATYAHDVPFASLSNNGIGPAGAKAIGGLLAKNKTILELRCVRSSST